MSGAKSVPLLRSKNGCFAPFVLLFAVEKMDVLPHFFANSEHMAILHINLPLVWSQNATCGSHVTVSVEFENFSPLVKNDQILDWQQPNTLGYVARVSLIR